MSQFYDGTKLLSMKDLNGNIPEVFITTTNRSAGKTTFFNRMVAKRFKEKGRKFALLYRWNYEMVECAEKFAKDIQPLFFPNDEFTDKRRMNGIFVELFMNGKSCGYCIALNSADNIKKFSHYFSDVDTIIFDEFQSESNRYCPDEINKFHSIHTSLARGGGQQVRYLPVIMISNPVSLINPYYMTLGIADRLQKDTKYLRGNGFIFEQGFYEDVAQQQKDSGFNQAFSATKYYDYATEMIYLNDSESFIDKPTGISHYVITLKGKDKAYGVRYYPENGWYYIDSSCDMNYRLKISFKPSEHDENFIMVTSGSPYVTMLKMAFEKGCIRFKNQDCKSAFFTMLKYNMYD